MRVTRLQIQAQLENVTELLPSEDFVFFFKMQCDNCRAETESPVGITFEKISVMQGKAFVNLIYKCKDCGRSTQVSILENSLKPYNIEDTNTFKTFIEFDFRGSTPISYEPGPSMFKCKGAESGKIFDNIDLSGLEWADYDDEENVPVGIYEFSSRFETR